MLYRISWYIRIFGCSPLVPHWVKSICFRVDASKWARTNGLASINSNRFPVKNGKFIQTARLPRATIKISITLTKRMLALASKCGEGNNLHLPPPPVIYDGSWPLRQMILSSEEWAMSTTTTTKRVRQATKKFFLISSVPIGVSLLATILYNNNSFARPQFSCCYHYCRTAIHPLWLVPLKADTTRYLYGPWMNAFLTHFYYHDSGQMRLYFISDLWRNKNAQI